MRTSKLADYAVVIMYYLASVNKKCNAKTISKHIKISPPTVSKILKNLASAKLVFSTKGPTGGYELAKPANQIPFFSIAEAIEGKIGFSECITESGKCEFESVCKVREKIIPFHLAFINLTTKFTLQDLVDDITEHPLIKELQELAEKY